MFNHVINCKISKISSISSILILGSVCLLFMVGLMALLTILVGLGYMLVYVCHASPKGSVSNSMHQGVISSYEGPTRVVFMLSLLIPIQLIVVNIL